MKKHVLVNGYRNAILRCPKGYSAEQGSVWKGIKTIPFRYCPMCGIKLTKQTFVNNTHPVGIDLGD